MSHAGVMAGGLLDCMADVLVDMVCNCMVHVQQCCQQQGQISDDSDLCGAGVASTGRLVAVSP